MSSHLGQCPDFQSFNFIRQVSLCLPSLESTKTKKGYIKIKPIEYSERNNVCGHDRFLSNLLQFIIHLSPVYLTSLVLVTEKRP
jgi:hypothetical protein